MRPAERTLVRPVDDGYLSELVELGREHGLDHVGVTTADVLDRALTALHARGAAGLADTMQFTYRNPQRSTDPRRAVPGARSVLVGARSYRLADEPPAESSAEEQALAGSGRVARYAWVDHYQPLRVALRAVADRLRADGHRAVAYADDNSIVDREVAWRAGLGWFGKNANLLIPGAGSWFVLGCVVTTAELAPSEGPVDDACGTCVRCLDACPTQAIVAPGVVDARRCLAWLVQKPGVFPSDHRVALGDRFYGCDDCQEVCPPTVRLGARHTHTTPAAAGEVQNRVDTAWVLRATDDELVERYGRWYLAGRDPRWWRRNALVVLANTAKGSDDVVAELLCRYLGHADPLLRAHAVWAAARLGRRDLLPSAGADTDPLVADELANLPETRPT